MEIVLEKPDLLKKSMEVISDLVGEGTFVFKKDYLELVALNSNNVVMVVFKLLATNFESYNVKEETKISLSLANFYNILKSCDDKFKLRLIVVDSRLKVISGDREKNAKKFELSLIEFSDENLQKVPSLDFPLKIVAKSQTLTGAINDLGFIDEGLTLRAEGKDFSIEGKTSSMSGNIDLSENVDMKVNDDKSYSSSYSMEYLKKFIKCEKLVKDVDISFGSDYPLKLEYKIVDRLLLSFILAPRGED
jgi:proliferating cell nuclear antigen